MNVVVVLAAGASRRMGQPKALLELAGRTCLERIVTSAHGADLLRLIVVVAPPHGGLIQAALPAAVELVWNESPERGMFSSLQCGLSRVPLAAESVLVWPVDHPLVQSATLRRLLSTPPEVIVIPRHCHRGGHPVRIPRRFFAPLVAQTQGTLRQFIQERPDAIYPLEVEDPWTVNDLDTPEDAACAAAWLKQFPA